FVRVINYTFLFVIFTFLHILFTGYYLPANKFYFFFGLFFTIFACESYGFIRSKIENISVKLLLRNYKKFHRTLYLLSQNLHNDCSSPDSLRKILSDFSSNFLGAELINLSLKKDVLLGINPKQNKNN